MTKEREVARSISILKMLKEKKEKERDFFALQTARPTPGSDDHVKWRSRLREET